MVKVSRRELIKLGTVASAGAMLPALPVEESEAAVATEPSVLTGRIVVPSDPDYEASRKDWDGLFSHYPSTIAFCQETEDVVNALSWARQNDLAFRVRSGRHNLEGWSNIDGGLVIDVSDMKSVAIDAEAMTATLGAGLTQGEAVAALGAAGFAIPTGSEATVGLVGATLGGGFGLLTRAFGMACDNLLGVDVVVPAGRDGAKAIRADRRRHRDLLWACRGGGGGNFGIVTSLTFQLHPIGDVAFLFARWPNLDDLTGVFNAWQETTPAADERLSSIIEIGPTAISMYSVLVGGSIGEIEQMLAPILAIGSPTLSPTVDTWPNVFASFQSPRQNANWKFSSQFVKEPFPFEAIQLVRAFIEEAPSPPSNYFCSSFGGAVARAPKGGSAFVHRDALFYAEPGAGWNGDEITSNAQAWVAELSQSLTPYVDGAYVNVPNAAMAGWEQAYYGKHAKRLRRIKRKYDPRNVFRFEQSIPLR